MNLTETPLLFERSTPGKRAWLLPPTTVPTSQSLPSELLRQHTPQLPELAEIDLVRHFTKLSTRNHGVDSGFYPLGSCTMKYNPKINEDLAASTLLQGLHPSTPSNLTQGTLALMEELELRSD